MHLRIQSVEITDRTLMMGLAAAYSAAALIGLGWLLHAWTVVANAL